MVNVDRFNGAGCSDDVPRPRDKGGEVKNLSGISLKPLYTPQDVQAIDYDQHIGNPGEYPYVRGVYQSMYRGRLWSKRMLIGFESPETWNNRQKAMFRAGQTAVNLVYCNTWMRGFDVDQVEKELVGTCGTPVNALVDMEICFDGVPVDEVSVALNDCGPFTGIAMLISLAQKRGTALDCLRGTTNQSDFISHYVSQHMYHRFSLDGHERMTIDHIKYVIQNMPLWNPLSIVGQHMQQAGATPVQEMAFTIASGIYYIDQCVRAGMDVDDFAPRFTFFFDVTISIFEEAAKFRAGRRVWAKLMRERFSARDPRSMRMKFHAQTSGRELTRQQVKNNIARVALQALGAVLGGAQSLHTDAYDEALNSPTREAARVALMTQNIIAEETGVADVIDPLGGSYYLETLTDEMEERIWEYIHKIDALGGMLEAVKKGFIQSEITRSSLECQRAIDSKERILVGLNDYVIPEEEDVRPATPHPDLQAVDRHVQRIKELRANRDQARAQSAKDNLKRAGEDQNNNLFEAVIEAVKSDVTHGEIVSTLQEVYGVGVPTATIGKKRLAGETVDLPFRDPYL
ncbi:MAG: methylmalonyl-CoA mutase [Dehalococcoidia bacterium]